MNADEAGVFTFVKVAVEPPVLVMVNDPVFEPPTGTEPRSRPLAPLEVLRDNNEGWALWAERFTVHVCADGDAELVRVKDEVAEDWTALGVYETARVIDAPGARVVPGAGTLPRLNPLDGNTLVPQVSGSAPKFVNRTFWVLEVPIVTPPKSRPVVDPYKSASGDCARPVRGRSSSPVSKTIRIVL
jgi:hypothetical protein